MLERILNIIFPPVCGICGKIDKNFLCKKCQKKLEKQSYFKVDTYEINFKEHMFIFKYDGDIRDLILKYKFKEQSYLYKTFANFMLKNEIFFDFIKKYDIIIPIPISQKRYNQRGYNQSLLIAKELAKKTNLKLENEIIFKQKNIIEQSKLDKKQREENIKNVYKIRKTTKIEGKNILIFDDIFTTGNTVIECAQTLETLNPQKIGVLTIAKD